MRRFRFSLAPVLAAKRRSEDALRARAARLAGEMKAEEVRVREVGDTIRRARRELAGVQASTVDAQTVLAHLAYISRLGSELAQRRRRLEELAQEKAAVLSSLLQVAKERKALERLRAREKARHEAEEARREMKELDDVAAVTGARRRAQLEGDDA